MVQDEVGFRATCDWDSGDLPAPWAQGDVLHILEDVGITAEIAERIARYPIGGPMVPMGGKSSTPLTGYYVVTYGPSIDEGDAWYFRVESETGTTSDRLHVSFPGRCSWESPECVNFMAPFVLVETADPEGLALREQMIADGWAYAPRESSTCPHCGKAL